RLCRCGPVPFCGRGGRDRQPTALFRNTAGGGAAARSLPGLAGPLRLPAIALRIGRRRSHPHHIQGCDQMPRPERSAPLGSARSSAFFRSGTLPLAGGTPATRNRRRPALRRPKLLSNRGTESRLLATPVCPLCKGGLDFDRAQAELSCRAYALAYPVRDGIPVMLESEARQLDAARPDAG